MKKQKSKNQINLPINRLLTGGCRKVDSLDQTCSQNQNRYLAEIRNNPFLCEERFVQVLQISDRQMFL